MKFSMKLDTVAATAALVAAADAAMAQSQQWDLVQFFLPDGGQIQGWHDLTRYTADEEAATPEWEGGYPSLTEITGMRAGSMGGTVTLTPEGEGWRLTFEGRRDSLQIHWQVLFRLLKEAEAAGTMVEDYASSIPGMLPWEDLPSWYCRMTGEAEGPNPFPYGDEASAAEEAARTAFNQDFFSAILEMAEKGTLEGGTLRFRRNLIVGQLRKEFRLPARRRRA